MLEQAARRAAMDIKTVGHVGGIVVQHRNDIRPPVLLKADMGDVGLLQKLLGTFWDSTFRMLPNGRGPLRTGGFGHANTVAGLSERSASCRFTFGSCGCTSQQYNVRN